MSSTWKLLYGCFVLIFKVTCFFCFFFFFKLLLLFDIFVIMPVHKPFHVLKLALLLGAPKPASSQSTSQKQEREELTYISELLSDLWRLHVFPLEFHLLLWEWSDAVSVIIYSITSDFHGKLHPILPGWCWMLATDLLALSTYINRFGSKSCYKIKISHQPLR